jgi:hypothetical protein
MPERNLAVAVIVQALDDFCKSQRALHRAKRVKITRTEREHLEMLKDDALLFLTAKTAISRWWHSVAGVLPITQERLQEISSTWVKYGGKDALPAN